MKLFMALKIIAVYCQPDCKLKLFYFSLNGWQSQINLILFLWSWTYILLLSYKKKNGSQNFKSYIIFMISNKLIKNILQELPFTTQCRRLILKVLFLLTSTNLSKMSFLYEKCFKNFILPEFLPFKICGNVCCVITDLVLLKIILFKKIYVIVQAE